MCVVLTCMTFRSIRAIPSVLFNGCEEHITLRSVLNVLGTLTMRNIRDPMVRAVSPCWLAITRYCSAEIASSSVIVSRRFASSKDSS